MNDPQSRARSDARVIAIRGAREHNLKNIDVEIPRDRLVVFTGLSGSGKSSLAFDTIYAEGQRRYVEIALGLCPPVPRDDAEAGRRPDRRPVARHLDRAEDHLEEPALDRRHRHRDLRLHAPAVGARRRALFAGDRPADREPDRVADGRPRAGAARRHAPLPAGAGRARPQGRVPQGARRVHEARASSASRSTAPSTRSREAPALDKKLKHDIEVVVDRIVVRGDIATRLAEFPRDRAQARRRPRRRRVRGRSRSRPVITGPPRSGGSGIPLTDQGGRMAGTSADRTDDSRRAQPQRSIFSEKFACPVSGFTIPEIEPRLFSFNNPFGACPACGGLGTEQHIDPELVVPDDTRRCATAPSRPGRNPPRPITSQTLEALAQALQVHARHHLEGAAGRRRRTPSSTAPARTRSTSPTTTACAPTRPRTVRGRHPQSRAPLQGDRERVGARGDLQKYFTDMPCDACHG